MDFFREITGVDTSGGDIPIRIEFDIQTSAILALFVFLAVVGGTIVASKI